MPSHRYVSYICTCHYRLPHIRMSLYLSVGIILLHRHSIVIYIFAFHTIMDHLYVIRNQTKYLSLLIQVSGIAWNKYHRQFITSHGGPKHQMSVWKYPSLHKVGEVTGHQGRILHMCLSPKRSSVASASADETMRIWKCFDEPDLETSQRTYSEDSISALLQSFNN